MLPDFMQQVLLRLLHALNHLLAGDPAREVVSVRQQAALARNLLDVAGQYIVLQQARDNLLRGESLWNAAQVGYHFAFDDRGDHVAHTGMRLKLVLAGLEILARLKYEYAADEQPWLIDDAFARQNIGDVAHPGTTRNIDGAIRLQRARGLEALLAEKQRDTGGQGHKNKGADDGVADNDQRMPRARRAARRHIHPVGLDRRSWAAGQGTSRRIVREVGSCHRRTSSPTIREIDFVMTARRSIAAFSAILPPFPA